jgi:hypothetical protein
MPAIIDASCDGIDDDCSGEADEDFSPVVTQCEVSGCRATGTLQCAAGGMLQDTCPTAPICVAELACGDHVDNDGDGATDCADEDCLGAPACAVQPFAMTVDGRANLWGAGHATPPGSQPGQLPPGVVLELGAGSSVVFTSVTGAVVHSGVTSLPPDGIVGAFTWPSSGGIAGYSHATHHRALSGVFLGPSEPTNPAPVSFAHANSEFTSISPGLRQMFFIGDGRTSSNEVQRFVVPAGATRLFIGNTDLCSGGVVGCFNDNSGSFSVSGQVQP